MKANKVVIHHSATWRDLNLWLSLQSFDKNHKERIWSLPSKIKNPQTWIGRHVTYHFVIDAKGEHVQCRDIDEPGRHASNLSVNNSSIAICFLWNLDTEEPTAAQYAKAWKILKRLRKEIWPMTIHPHNEFAKKTCPWKNVDIQVIESEASDEEQSELYYSQLFQAVFKWRNKTFVSPQDAEDRLNKIYHEKWVPGLIQEIVSLIAILTTKQDIASTPIAYWSDIVSDSSPCVDK